jgi:hypothetical protein
MEGDAMASEEQKYINVEENSNRKF